MSVPFARSVKGQPTLVTQVGKSSGTSGGDPDGVDSQASQSDVNSFGPKMRGPDFSNKDEDGNRQSQ